MNSNAGRERELPTWRVTGERDFLGSPELLPSGYHASAIVRKQIRGLGLTSAVNHNTYTFSNAAAGDDWTATFTAEPASAAAPFDRRLSDALDWAHWIEDHAEDLDEAKVAAGFAAWAIQDFVGGG